MANAQSNAKNSNWLVGALQLTAQAAGACPIPAGEQGFWNDNGTVKLRLANGTDQAEGDIQGVTAGTGLTGGGTTGTVTLGLASNGVTGPSLSASAMRFLKFAGNNGAGACPCTGLKVGDTVIGIVDASGGGGSTSAASFQSTITVQNEIQQTDAADLSGSVFVALVVAKS